MAEASLEQRRVLITGAGSGIGRALAECAISAGADVTAIDVDGDALAALPERGGGATCRMDVADPDAWEKLPSPKGGWELVALNAGIMTAPPDAGPEASDLLAMSLRSYHQVMGVNVDGVVFGVRRVLPELAPGGAIVVTASAAGVVGYAQDVTYAMTKHAVVGLVRSLARVLAPARERRRICAICPGGVRTGIVPAAFQGIPMMAPEVIAGEIVDLWHHGKNGEVRVKMRAEIPAQRIDEPELPPWW